MKAPKEPSLGRLVTEEDIRFYVQQFKKSGFRYAAWWPEHSRGLVSCCALSVGQARTPSPEALLTCLWGWEAHHGL